MIILLLVLVSVALTTAPVVAQHTELTAKVSVAVYEAERADGAGFGLAGAVEHRIGAFGITAEVGGYALGTPGQTCTTGVPGDCFPESSPQRVLDVGLSVTARPVDRLAFRGGASLVRRQASEVAVHGGLALALGPKQRFGVEGRYMRFLSQPTGWLTTLGLTYRVQ